MKKWLWAAVAIIAAYIAILQMSKAGPQAQALVGPTARPATATRRATSTPVPSATIGYQATAIIAQATADEARRVNVMVTAQFEQRAQEQLQMTAAYEQRVQEIYAWTATAALTAVPLTATQQVHSNTAVAARQMLERAELTATHEAPTQIAAMAQAANEAKYGWMSYVAMLAGVGVIVIFLIALTAWILRNPVVTKPTQAPKTFTVNYVDRRDGKYKQTNLEMPCTPDQLTELAELASNNERHYGINRIEQSSRTFRNKRGALVATRDFLVANDMAIKDEHGGFTLNDDGVQFLADWFDTHELPEGYSFDDGEQEEAEVVDE